MLFFFLKRIGITSLSKVPLFVPSAPPEAGRLSTTIGAIPPKAAHRPILSSSQSNVHLPLSPTLRYEKEPPSIVFNRILLPHQRKPRTRKRTRIRTIQRQCIVH